MKILNLIKITQSLKREFQNGRHFHATIAVKGGNIIAIGHNDYQKEHPRKVYGNYIPKNGNKASYRACLHSEIACLKQIQHRDDLHKVTLINIRIDNNGNLANAKPCINCKRVLKNFKFKRIYYTIDNHNLGRYLNNA